MPAEKIMWKLVLFTIYCGVAATGNKERPNIVIVLADDQDLVLGGLVPLVKTCKLVANMGATFLNAFVTTPICCPSRSSFLTGLYMHNHHTVNNSVYGGCSSKHWQNVHERRTFPALLQRFGYKTFYGGKYLNQYGKRETGGPQHVPPGWDWWIGLIGNSRYYNYQLSVNGSSKHHSEDYLTDVIKEYAVSFLQQNILRQENFLMVLSPPAPHAPFIPSPKYKDMYRNVTALQTPNFNIPVGKEKHWLLRMKPSPLPNSTLNTLNYIYHRRWETLCSVDDMVETVINELENRGVLNNTYIIYTSDHGFHIGQFSLPWDKRQPYEFDIRIPLLIRGPGIPEKIVIEQPVLNIDMAPTILSMVGLPAVKYMDGKSFFHLFKTPSKNDGITFLVEYKGEGNHETVESKCFLPLDDNLSECTSDASCKCQDSRNNTYICVRHLTKYTNFLYCKFEDKENFIEAYDLLIDPYQLQNIASSLENSVIRYYENMMELLIHCNGKNCQI